MARPPLESQALSDLAAFARELAARARIETLPRFGTSLPVDDKGREGLYDPVTEADRSAEAAMRELIASRFPDHGISGEEFGDKPGSSPLAWILDPIDGTRSYMCGLPTWTTLIALLRDREPLVGLIDAPALDETYIGVGDRALLVSRGQRLEIRSSGCAAIADARFSTTDPFLFESSSHKLDRMVRSVRLSRFGHDGYAYARLAAGSIDLVIESDLKPYDFQAHVPVIRAAGGHIGDWNGGTDFTAGNVIAAASRQLYDEAVELMSEA